MAYRQTYTKLILKLISTTGIYSEILIYNVLESLTCSYKRQSKQPRYVLCEDH